MANIKGRPGYVPKVKEQLKRAKGPNLRTTPALKVTPSFKKRTVSAFKELNPAAVAAGRVIKSVAAKKAGPRKGR